LLVGLLRHMDPARSLVFVNTKDMAERLMGWLNANGLQAAVLSGDVPQNAEDYVHRIGRTARAGKSGDAVSFACERYVFGLPEIEAYIGHKIPVAATSPELLPALQPPALSDGMRERRGRERGDRRPRRGERSAQRPDRPPRERPARAETRAAPPKPDEGVKRSRPAAPPSGAPRRRGETPVIG